MLISNTDLRQKNQHKLLAAVERMPAFPKSVQEVLRLAQDSNCLPRDLVQVIQHDPVFTLKILRVVNSPFIGLLRPITSIHQASIYLGMNTLKHLALNLATVGALARAKNMGFSWLDFWWHSLSVAIISKRLAGLLNCLVDDQAEFFSAGLLHDIGKIVFALYLPEGFALAQQNASNDQTMLYSAETTIMGLNHADVGGMLAQKWDFPDLLADGIARHHSIGERMNDLAICVFTANQISKLKNFGFAGEAKIEDLPDFITDRFHMNMGTITAQVEDVDDELEKAKIFISV